MVLTGRQDELSRRGRVALGGSQGRVKETRVSNQRVSKRNAWYASTGKTLCSLAAMWM